MIVLAPLALTTVMAGRAQKIDQRLTKLVQQPTAQRCAPSKVLGGETVTDRINVTLNGDGTVSSTSAIAILKKGAECPT